MPAQKKSIELTAFNPANGKSKLLDREEQEDLLGVLVAYEEAVRSKGEPGAPEKLSRCSGELEARGLDPKWFDAPVVGGGPLFKAVVDGREISGRCLKDLLETAREAGIIEASWGRAKEKLIYLVDDDDTFREMLAFALRKEGFQIDLYVNGVELITALQSDVAGKPPDMILLDLMMPQQGGFEVARELQMRSMSRVPVIVLTGRNVDSRMVDMLRNEANVVEFFTKPLKTRELTNAIHTRLRTKPSAA